MNKENMLDFLLRNIESDQSVNVFDEDCENIVYLLEHCDITVPESNRFFVQTNTDWLMGKVYHQRAKKLRNSVETQEIKNGAITYAFTGLYDFSHTSPYWEDVLSLGIYGLRERLVSYSEKSGISDGQRAFYQGCIQVYDAALRFIQRAGAAARAHGKDEMADGLEFLAQNKPHTLYQQMQTVFIFYTLQHATEVTYLRTLGRLDSLFYPSFIKEPKESGLQLIRDFILEIDTLQAPANIPFAICGTSRDGNDLTNELSFHILNIYGELNTTNTKFHILCDQKTPDSLIKRAFEIIRGGKNSIVFISNETAIEGLKQLGAAHADACNYHVVGCYECGAEGELTCSCNARVNIAKALEVTLNRGKDVYTDIPLIELPNEDLSDFESLFGTFEKVLLHFTEKAMEATNKWERLYPLLHCSPFLSSTYPSSLEKGADLYCSYSAKYNNSSVNAIGLATAVDSLAAIRQLVFTERKFTLEEFADILKSNWENHEILRLRIKNSYPKYGMGDACTDLIASDIIKALSQFVNGKPNAKNGVWRLGTFSIDWRWDFGEHTHASADGRRAGESLSQNTSASFGADKQGATAHLLSVTAFPHTLTPNGSIADIDLHISAVRGENGINALFSTLKTYFARKGLAIHYNVLDTETLKKAKEDPAAYPNLQVRLCGWNVLFSSLSEKEKDEFIARSEKEAAV